MSIYPGDEELEKAIDAGDKFQIATLLSLRIDDRLRNNDIDGVIDDLREASKHYSAADKKVDQFMVLYSAIPFLAIFKRIAEAEEFLTEVETLLNQIDPAEFPVLPEQTLTQQVNEQESYVVYKSTPTQSPDEFYREGLENFKLLIQQQR